MTDQKSCCKKSFWESAGDTAKRVLEDPSLAPIEVRKERMAICGMCEYMEHNRCTLCSCFLPSKTTFANMTCPHDPPKWTQVNS